MHDSSIPAVRLRSPGDYPAKWGPLHFNVREDCDDILELGGSVAYW